MKLLLVILNTLNNMKGVFQKGVFGNIELKKRLFSLVQLKYSIAEYVWYILGGLLVTSVSFNYIVNTVCSMSADEMKRDMLNIKKKWMLLMSLIKLKNDVSIQAMIKYIIFTNKIINMISTTLTFLAEIYNKVHQSKK